MAFLIIDNWNFLSREVWVPLEKLETTRTDIYIELLRFYYVSHGIDLGTKTSIIHDPELAKSEFKNIPSPSEEEKCILLLEGYYEVLTRFSSVTAAQYKDKLSEFLGRYNLRYLVDENCKIHLSLQGVLMSLVLRLRKSIAGNDDRVDSFDELESSLSMLLSGRYANKNCIRVSSNLLEGLVIDRSGNKANTLTSALQYCSDLFPHISLENALKEIYKFCSDYPNLRHGGNRRKNPNSLNRNLKHDDALLIAALSIVLSSYISSTDDGHKILKGSF